MITKILFAQGEPDTLETTKRLITGGFEVFPAANGRLAYDLTLKHGPDLIVTEMIMPIMSGFELCKALKGNEQTKDLPIIVLSAKPKMEDSFMTLGVHEFLRKPYVFEHLESRIKDRLSLAEAMHTQKTKVLFHCAKGSVMNSARTLIEAVPQWSSVFVSWGKEVVDNAKKFLPEIILLDLFMEDASIANLVAQLKGMPELAHTQILTYYSPLSTTADSFAVQAKMFEVQYLKQATIEAGATGYLGPFNPANFMGLMNDYRKDLDHEDNLLKN